jgi:putative MFS transporter
MTAERRANLARALIVAITMNGALYISIFAFLTWLPSIMVAQGIGLPRSLLMNLLMSCGALLGTACGGLLSDFLGRRRSIVCLAGASAVLGITFPLMPGPQWQIVAGFWLYATIYALAVASVSIYAPELFPTKLRLRGTGTAVAVGRGFAIAAPFALPPLLAAYGLEGVTLILAVVLSIEILIVLSFGWETRPKE